MILDRPLFRNTGGTITEEVTLPPVSEAELSRPFPPTSPESKRAGAKATIDALVSRLEDPVPSGQYSPLEQLKQNNHKLQLVATSWQHQQRGTTATSYNDNTYAVT